MSGKGPDCIRRAVAAGLLDATRAEKAVRTIEQIEATYWDALGPIGARRQANMDALEMLKRDASDRKRAAMMQLLAQDRIARAMDAAQSAKGLDDGAKLLRATVDSTGMDGIGFRGAAQEHRRVRSLAHRMMADALQRFHHLPGGFARNKAQLVNVLKEIKGEATGDVAARQMAKAWIETAEVLRKMYNAVGGAIPKLKGWDVPQHHNAVKVRKTSFDDWYNFIEPLLDASRMLDHATGKMMTRPQMRGVLQSVYDSIRTQGWDKAEPKGFVQGQQIAMRHRDARVLHFSSAESWLKYNAEYGDGDVFSAMMNHVDMMSREIGAMRALGPNPRATLRFMGERLKKTAYEAGDAKMINRAERESKRALSLYSHYIGDANAPVDGTFARVFSSTRQVLTAAQLGSAVLSAVSDVAFSRITSKFNGISHWKVMRSQLKLLNPANAEDRKLAVRLGLIAEEWGQISASQMRYTGEVVSGEFARRLSDGVMRASGLSAWTQAGRWAFGMEFMGLMADNAGKRLDALPRPFRDALERYGVSADEWEIIRATDLYEPAKGGFLRPDDILARTDLDPKQADALATKLLDMVTSETEFAVPSTSIIGKEALIGDAKPGTIGGELLRSTLMYKNFAITLMHTHIMRTINQKGVWNKFRYGTSLLVSTTVMGGFAMMLKDLSRGRDPKPMASDGPLPVDGKFLARAMLQGGGLGIFGDFVLSDQSRFGMGGAATAAGPMVGFVYDTAKLAQKVVTADKTAGREAVNYVGRYTPGSSLWYARYGIERGILDELQEWVDPNAEKSFKARRAAQGNTEGSDYFAPRGAGLIPQRMPDFENMQRSFDGGKAAAGFRRYGGDPAGVTDTARLQAAFAAAKKIRQRKVQPGFNTPQQAIDAEARWSRDGKKRIKDNEVRPPAPKARRKQRAKAAPQQGIGVPTIQP